MKFISQILFLSEFQLSLSDPIIFTLIPSANKKSKPHVLWAHSRPFWLKNNHFVPLFWLRRVEMRAEQKDNLCHSLWLLKTCVCLCSNQVTLGNYIFILLLPLTHLTGSHPLKILYENKMYENINSSKSFLINCAPQNLYILRNVHTSFWILR